MSRTKIASFCLRRTRFGPSKGKNVLLTCFGAYSVLHCSGHKTTDSVKTSSSISFSTKGNDQVHYYYLLMLSRPRLQTTSADTLAIDIASLSWIFGIAYPKQDSYYLYSYCQHTYMSEKRNICSTSLPYLLGHSPIKS